MTTLTVLRLSRWPLQEDGDIATAAREIRQHAVRLGHNRRHGN
jgi:hypothetical protein